MTWVVSNDYLVQNFAFASIIILGLTKEKKKHVHIVCLSISTCELPVEQNQSMLLIEGKLHDLPFFFKAVNSNKSKGCLLKYTLHQRGQDKAVWQSSFEASRHMTRLWSCCSPHSIHLLPTAACASKCRSSCTQELLQWQINFLRQDFGFSGIFFFFKYFPALRSSC